jgi:hypothetical protein
MIYSVCGARDRTRTTKAVEADSAQAAAVEYVASDGRYDPLVTVLVCDPSGEFTRWLVEDISDPSFAATQMPLGGG